MPDTAQGFAEQEMQSVADAMRDAATAVDNAANDVPARAMRAVERLAYTSSYSVSYGVVYAAVFVAHCLPQDNPVMHGLRDGGRAARDALKSK